MSKTIKLEDKTYEELERFRGKRETYSQAVDRLLTIKGGVAVMVDVLEGNEKFQELMEKYADKETPRRSIVGLGINTGDDESP